MKWFFYSVGFLALSSFASAQISGPVMRLSTASVTPTAVAVGSNVAAQSVQIFNAGTGTLHPSVTSTASWVTAAVGAQATCPAGTFSGNCLPINLTFNTAALAAGTYSATVAVSDPGAVDAPQTISVVITIIGFASTTPIQLYAAPNGGTATATIDTHGVVNAVPSTATGGNWLTVSLSGNGSYSFYYPYQVKVTTQSGQAPGTYTGSVAISGSNTASDNVTVPVNLTVTSSPIAQLSATSITLIGGVDSQPSATVNVANAGEGSLTVNSATATVTTGSSWLTAALASGGGAVTITANPAALQPGTYTGSVTVDTNAANNSTLTIPVTLLVNTQTGPQINVGGVVDNAIGKTPLAPGDIAAAYGTLFSSATNFAGAIPLPTNLENVQVLVNGTAAPLFFTSTGQIDFQVPYETPVGTVAVQVVNNGVAGNKVSVAIVEHEPRILTFPGNVPIIIDYNTGKIPVSTTTLLPNQPAAPGDTLVIYCIGLGQTTPAATTGASSSGTPLQNTSVPAVVTLGGLFASTLQLTPAYAGLAPGFVGLYQVNVTIPSDYIAPADSQVSLTLSMQGAAALPLTIAIQ